KDELLQVDELRFLFDEPTFVEQMAELKEPKEFVLSKHARGRHDGLRLYGVRARAAHAHTYAVD
ncbi:MAG: hypothetical protein II578_01295, partial [Bacteroidaceae bacterium]|nr:hypothetical protein [Bacteroidaceae bacterium]